jgi:hypothetical protein
MYRLGLWGPGTSFVNGFDGFREAIERDGVGMMELVAMHMKRNGSYICRTLSFEGCSFQIVEDSLSNEQVRIEYKPSLFLLFQFLMIFFYVFLLSCIMKKNTHVIFVFNVFLFILYVYS